MKAMTWLCAVALVGGCVDEAIDEESVETAEQAATQTDVWHGTWNGASANVNFWGPNSSGYLSVFENKAGQYRAAYLNFSTWSVDPDSLQCFTYTDWWGWTWQYCYYTRYSFSYGWGEIPTQDAQLTPNHARVSTTLPATFGGYQCTIDYSNWLFECGAAAGGTVDIRWNKDGVYSQFRSGIDQQEYGPYTFKTQGTYRMSSALASGTLLNSQFENANGSFGDTRQTNVARYVMQTPTP